MKTLDKNEFKMKWNLRQLMADRKLKNRVLAKALGVHETSISRMKAHDEMPRIDGKSLKIICEMLNCSLTELLEDGDCA